MKISGKKVGQKLFYYRIMFNALITILLLRFPGWYNKRELHVHKLKLKKQDGMKLSAEQERKIRSFILTSHVALLSNERYKSTLIVVGKVK